MAPRTLGSRIRIAREAKGLSASELARLVGVTPTAVSNWESRGRRPRAGALLGICRALGVTEAYIVAGQEDAPEHMSLSGKSGVDAILQQAAAQIANALGISADRVKLKCEFSSRNE